MISSVNAYSISFLVALAFMSLPPKPATAETFIACHGEDAVARLKTTEPERYAALVNKAEKIPNGQGRLWRIEKPGVEPSYLFGTVHLADERLSKLPPELVEIIKGARLVYLENSDIISEDKSAANEAMTRLGLMTDGKTLRSLLGAQEYDKVAVHLASRGITLEAFNMTKPWVVAMLAMLPSCEIAMQIVNTPFVDARIGRLAIKEGVTLESLESIDEQLSYFNEIPLETQTAMLLDLTKFGSDIIDDFHQSMISLYQSGSIGLFWESYMDLFEVAPDDPLLLFLQERLLEDRNRIMFDRSVEKVDQGNILIAVGAAHLIGETGLVEQYRNAGFTVTKVID